MSYVVEALFHRARRLQTEILVLIELYQDEDLHDMLYEVNALYFELARRVFLLKQ